MRPALILTLIVLTPLLQSQTLVRKALIGLYVTEQNGSLVIDSVARSSTGSALELQKDDRLISVNGQTVTDFKQYIKLVSEIRAGDKFEAQIRRKNKVLTRRTIALARPLLRSNHAYVTYDWIPFRAGYLRTITYKPIDKEKVPAILFIPGYGCGSIENYKGSYNGRLIDDWLQNGYAVVTVEKSGMGDSFNCLPCAEVDLATDIESFDAGFRYMKKLDYVDQQQLYIWGHSLGGMIAPEIARRHKPNGVMVFGTVFRPWVELLPEMHRVQKPLMEGLTMVQTEQFLRGIQKVYFEFFVLKESRTALAQNPEYSALVLSELEHKDNDNNMWGRHWRFWQQIDSLNLAKSWAEVQCPLLIINGGSDYEQCAPIEPLLIEQTVNETHAGNATRVQIEDLDHFMMQSSSYPEALQNFRNRAFLKGNFNTKISAETINWLNKQTGKS